MRIFMPELSTIYDYMRANAGLLGTRILEQFPALQQIDDPVSPRIEGLLRRPFPAQTVAIMGLAKRWRQAQTGMVVAECGTGKTLISLGGSTSIAKANRSQRSRWSLPIWSRSGHERLYSPCRECTCS
jgi:hypothetical protein